MTELHMILNHLSQNSKSEELKFDFPLFKFKQQVLMRISI